MKSMSLLDGRRVAHTVVFLTYAMYHHRKEKRKQIKFTYMYFDETKKLTLVSQSELNDS